MTALIACLGAGKGTWAEVAKIIKAESWDKIILVTNSFGREKFQAGAEFMVIDDFRPAHELTNEIVMQLKGKLAETEVALSLASGSGNVHMALLSALLKLGFGIRLVSVVNDKIEEV